MLSPGAAPPAALNRCAMTCARGYSITRGIFTAVNHPPAPPVHPPRLQPPQPLTLVPSPQFCLFQNVTDLESHSARPLPTGFLHVVTGTPQGSDISGSIYDLVSKIVLSGYFQWNSGVFRQRCLYVRRLKQRPKKKNHDYCFFLFYVLGETYDRLLILYE